MNVALPGIFQRILEIVEPLPPRYDASIVTTTLPDPKHERTTREHVIACRARHIEIRTAQQDAAIERARDRRLLWILIGLSVGGNAEAIQAVANFITN